MSLINQMLKELDARVQSSQGSAALDPIGAQFGLSQAPRNRGVLRRWWWWVLLALGVLVLWAGYRFLHDGTKDAERLPLASRTASGQVSPAPRLPARPSAPALADTPAVQLSAMPEPETPPLPAVSAATAAPLAAREQAPALPSRAAIDHAATASQPAVQLVRKASPAPASGQDQDASTGEVGPERTPKQDRSASARTESVPSLAPPVAPAASSMSDALPTLDAGGLKQAAGSPVVKRRVNPQQRADNAYRTALAHLRDGLSSEAEQQLLALLREAPTHADGRQLLAWVYSQTGRQPQALVALREGIRLAPESPRFYQALAVLEQERGDLAGAAATLLSGLGAAGGDADYHAQTAALLQRLGRHQEARDHYVVALRQRPQQAVWLLGLAVSLQASQQTQQAVEAYQRALDIGVPADLASFARERLNALGY